MVVYDDITKEKLVEKILKLSHQISYYSPAMKPFIRFGMDTEAKARRYWDFDDMLQKMLLVYLSNLVSGDTIVKLGIQQWQRNMDSMATNRQKAIKQHTENNSQYSSFGRTGYLVDLAKWMKPQSRVLFVGAGTGPSCLFLAQNGYDVVGIDPIISALKVGKQWAQHLYLDVTYLGMDMSHLAFKAETFDYFFLGVYGALPTTAQTIALQRQFARILRPNGLGFVTALRKKYLSYWFRMGSMLPKDMVDWLIPQADLDFYFTSVDGYEKRLSYGFFSYTHDRESLSQELRTTFDVVSCDYDRDDSRYLSAVVHPRNDIEFDNGKFATDAPISHTISGKTDQATIEMNVALIDQVCALLKDHTEQAIRYFKAEDNYQPLKHLSPDLDNLIGLLGQLSTQN